MPPWWNPTRDNPSRSPFVCLQRQQNNAKESTILRHSIFSHSNSCSSALSGFHQTLSILLSSLIMYKGSLFSLKVQFCQGLEPCGLPAFYLDRPFGFSAYPRIYACLFLIRFAAFSISFYILLFFQFFFQIFPNLCKLQLERINSKLTWLNPKTMNQTI